MAAGLSPQDRDVLLQAIIAGGGDGMTNPSQALQNLLRAPGGASAAQAIVAGLRNKLLPSGGTGMAAGPAGPASIAARGLSGAEPTYAQDDESRRPSGILGGPGKTEGKPAVPKTDDIAEAAKKLADKTPDPAKAAAPAGNGILAMGPSQGPDPGTVQVPNIPDVPSTVNRSVARGVVADRARSWTSFLMKPVDQGGLGRTAAQAQGEVASLFGESGGLNPNLTHDHGTGYGTAAWRDEPWEGGSKRKTGLINFNKQNGLDHTTIEGQQAYYRHEMLTTEGRANAAISAAKTPQEALSAHVRQFERPKYKDREVQNRAQHIPTVQAAMGGAREVGTGPDSMGRGATTGQGNAPGLKPAPAPTQKAAPQPTGILAAPKPDVQAPTAPEIPAFKDSGGRQIKGLVLHHTADDNGQVPRNVDDLKAMYAKGGVTGAHLFIDREGRVHQTMDFGQKGQHTLPGQGPGAGFGNSNTVGIEIAAANDADVLPVQVETVKRLWPALQAKYPGIQPLAHGEINAFKLPGEDKPHKEPTEGASALAGIRSLGQNLPKPGEDVPLPPRRPDDLGVSAPSVTETPDQARGGLPAPDVSAPDPDFADITPAEQASLGGDDMGGIPDIGGLLGGLDSGDAGAEEPSQFAQDAAQDEAQEAREPEKPLLPEEDKQPGGILSGGGLLGDQDQDRVDLARVFSPEGFGGSGLLGRDQGPDTTGFKAPVGLPQGGQTVGPMGVVPGAGILAGAPSGIASITPPQLRSIAPSPAAPLPPPRPSNLDLGILASPPQLDMPAIPSPGPSNLTAGLGDPVPLPPRRPTGIEGTLPPPRPVGIGGEVPLPPRRPQGLLASSPAADIKLPSLVGAPTPDIASLSPPSATPQPTGILGSLPAQPAAPGILGQTFAQDAAKPTPPNSIADLSRLMDSLPRTGSGGLGGASGLLAGSGAGANSRPITSGRRRLAAAANRPLGLLSGGQAQIDLNRYFGLLSGRVG